MIIPNVIPLLEYDDSSLEVIAPNHDCRDLSLPEKSREFDSLVP